MKLKKFLLILFAAVSCICIGFAFGCKDNPTDNNGNKCTVNFAASEYIKYVIEDEEVEEYQVTVDKNATLKFSVVVEDGALAETLVVKANDSSSPLAPVDGVYSYQVTKDATITATVSEDLLEYDETNKVYLISSLKDLRFVADMVNSGYSNYVTGSYKLLNDIDCGGAQLDVIGHFENQYSFFSGTFDGDGHTISNYTISEIGKTYVGFFGCVQLSTATSSAIIQNLNLKNFTVNATALDDGSVCVGGIAAFTAGANVVACSAEGRINVYGSGYFSYAGGAVGIQQSLSVSAGENLLYHYHSTTEYVRTKVVIAADRGYIFGAGGVVGYAISSHERAASMIMNSYAEGNVFGAMRSGGVVGILDNYSSVANCYATGYVSSTVTFPTEVKDSDYFAYAGGIAGYVGVETTISDSFTTCTLYTETINTGKVMGDIYAYASPATDFIDAVTVYNSYASCETDLTDAEIGSYATPGEVKPTEASFIKGTLNWNETDWVIKDGAYPVTNFAQGESSFDITLDYKGKAVHGSVSKTVSVEIKDSSYFSFSSYLDDGDIKIDEFILADAAGYTSFGFFFDEACTQKVHYSFVPTRNITLYVGFANYSEVAGTYEFKEASGRTVKLILDTDATYTYIDVGSPKGTYVYDGTKIIFNDALFARLSSNMAFGENERPLPWLNYEPYKFVGTLSDGKILVYDGTYFTNETINGTDNRLAFTKASSEQTDKNDFVGTWERSATVNEKYTFNSDLTWSYRWKGNTQSGKYSITEGVATLTNTAGDTEIATAKIDNSGLLLITETGKDEKSFRLVNSFSGNWYSEEGGDYLVLDGFGNGLEGNANAIIDGTVYENLSYVKDGFFDAFAPDNDYTYTLLSGYSLFGYFTYDATTNTISASLYDASADGFIEFNFALLDYYLGEWIGEDEVGGETPFTIMDFNGLGLYKAEGDASLGYIVINGTKVPYDCSVGNGLDGAFTYGGTDYLLTTNADGTVTIKFGDNDENSANFYRKDEMASMPLVDAEDNVYRFNGGGNLSNGGILTITSKSGETVDEYGYKIESGSVDDLDIVINLFDLVDGKIVGGKVGTITINDKEAKFVLNIDGQDEKSLDLYFAFTGTWSISGLMNNFRIGKFDLTYRATGTYNGQNNVPFDYYPEYNYIYVYFRVDGEGFDSYYIQNYLLLIDDNNLIVSSYPYLVSGDQTYYATHSDELVGKWENTVTGAMLEFDGLADSKYTVGVARDSNGLEYFYTRRFGTLYLWLESGDSVIAAYTVNYDENDDELSGVNVYRKPNTRFGRLELTIVDDILGEPIFTAAGNGVNYEFNFDGTVKVGDESGKYDLVEVNGGKTIVEITIDGTVTTVEVNHSEHTATVID